MTRSHQLSHGLCFPILIHELQDEDDVFVLTSFSRGFMRVRTGSSGCHGGLILKCLVSLICGSLMAVAQVPRSDQSTKPSLDEGFRQPPAAARPWVYWMWLGVKTNHAALTRDLEEMHAKGIEGAIIYDSGVGGGMEADSRMVLGHKGYTRVRTDDYAGAHFSPIPFPEMTTWGPESRELLRFAAKEAGRLRIKLVISIGLAGTSGDIAPVYGQQQLLWSELSVNGPSTFDQVLPEPLTIVHPSSTTSPGSTHADAKSPDGKLKPKDIAVIAVPDKLNFSASEAIWVHVLPDTQGELHWAVPPGKWKLLRFAYAPTGKTNAWGYFTDAMSAEALDATWNATIGPILAEMTPAEREGLYGIEDDSWEAGESTWTNLFAQEFQRLRGYDLIPWLPVLAGKQMGTVADRAGVQRDYNRTVADLIAQNHYAHLTELAHRNHLISYAEAAGPNSLQLDPLKNSSYIDVPMGEFWMPSQHRPTLDRRFLARDSASASHVYGKPINGCESFTSLGPFWEESFFDMKITADQAFNDGCNELVVHNFSQSPSLTAMPGYVYFAGTLYGRTTTWWNETPAFNAYLGRNDFLLQQGLFVADALYYRGDAIGQIEQRKTEPALPAPGFDHDNANLDVLLHRTSVHDGRITLPDGMSYRMIVLPDNSPMTMAALRKIKELVMAGAIVVGPRPTGIAGLITVPSEQKEFDSLVSQLWIADGGAQAHPDHVWNMSPVDALHALRLVPDFAYEGLSPDGEIDWIHRRAAGTDIYLVSSRWDPQEKIVAKFRVAGKQPELWDPITGEIRDARAFRQQDGLTIVPLEFNPRGSVFVVFRKSISSNASGQATTNYSKFVTVQNLSGPWVVSFDPKWGGPESVTFNTLVDWTSRPENGIRYYSGTAIYRKTLTLKTLPSNGEHLMLNLGQVHEVATVHLNGEDLGILWSQPTRVDITRAAHLGTNKLEISVVNLWPNRLIGDAAPNSTPHFTVTNTHKFNADTPLLPSGLLGPVTLEREVW